MIPPLVRRCPNCGSIRLSRRFVVVRTNGRLVECPMCHHRFDPIDNPWLK